MKVQGRKTLWRGRFIEAISIAYEDRRGVARQWEAVARVDSTEVVVVVPLTAAGDLILIRQYRPALDAYVIELPAGLVDRGESVLEAARRELLEETGHTTPDEMVLCARGVMSTGINAEKWRIVIARNVAEAPRELRDAHPLDDSEDIEVLKVPLDDVHAMLESRERAGDEVDLRIYGLLELARGRSGSLT